MLLGLFADVGVCHTMVSRSREHLDERVLLTLQRGLVACILADLILIFLVPGAGLLGLGIGFELIDGFTGVLLGLLGDFGVVDGRLNEWL